MTKVTATQTGDYFALTHWCPGCERAHVIPIKASRGPVWFWDGNTDAPTCSPSVRHFVRDKKGFEITSCHYFLAAGRIEFCNDCDHKFSGKTVELPNLPD